MSANPDPLTTALQLAQEQLNQRLAAFKDASLRVSELVTALQDARSAVARLDSGLVLASASVDKLQQLLSGK